MNINYYKYMPKFKSRGFTLIELMVAITIIAILSTIGYTIFSQTQVAARDGKRISDVQEVQKGLEQYYAVHREYIDDPNVDVNDLSDNNFTSYFQNHVPPSDPNPGLVSGFEYNYRSCITGATATQYIICARLENPVGKANMDAVPADGCADLADAGTTFYCVKSLSN